MKLKYRRICFWGGPGSGKTATAYHVCAEMRVLGYKVLFSEENITPWIYHSRMPLESYDDLLLFAQQLHAEETYLNPRKECVKPADCVITDCPPLMCCVYNKRRLVAYHEELLKI